MPRFLSVSEVRRHLVTWNRHDHPAASVTPLLGQLFHEAFAALTGPDDRFNLVRVLERADPTLESWVHQLQRHAYARVVGPQLAEHRGPLQRASREVLVYWAAVRAAVAWMAELVWSQREGGESLATLRARLFAEQELDLSLELTSPAWSDSVVLTGRVDAMVRHPVTGALCALELKLGRGAPEADLCQVLLYRKLAAASSDRPVERVAVVSFEPEVHERIFDALHVVDAQEALERFIGRLAGVTTAAAPDVGPSHAGRSRASTPLDPVSPCDEPEGTMVGSAAANAEHTPAGATGSAGVVGTYDDLQRRVLAAFAEFDARLRSDGQPIVGPTFVRFLAAPERGVRISRVVGLAESVWTRLGTAAPPQISLQRGRVAIDVERPDRVTVTWDAHVRPHLVARPVHGASRFPVGIGVDGALRWADLSMPEHSHFLVAGTTGSGKSEWLRMMLASLLATNEPDTLRLLLIDPKRTAFHAFQRSAFLWRDVIHPPDDDVVEVLGSLAEEMEKRYRWLQEQGLPDVGAYDPDRPAPLPRILCVCDEYADLVSGSRRRRLEVEELVGRLSAKARAAGINLVFATQHASREVITGVINANLMARVALKVTTAINSRLVVGHPGAARLLGRGDLLFRDLGEPVRLQAPLVSDEELAALARQATS